MFKTGDKSEAIKELQRINEDIERSYVNFNILRTIPILLCIEDTIGGLYIEYKRKILTEWENKKDPRHFGMVNFIIEWLQFLNIMVVNVLNKGFLDCTTKNRNIGINFGLSIERDCNTDIRNLVAQLQEEKYIGKKYFIRIQEREFMGRYPGAMFIILDGKTDKTIIQNLDKILELRQLMYKKGLLETMIYLAPIGTEIDFNEKGTFIKYPDNFTFDRLLELGVSHRLIEGFTHVTSWNSNFDTQVRETLKTIHKGKGKDNINNLRLEHSEIYNTYNELIGFPEIFKTTHGITLQVFLDIINNFIFDCYPRDNTLGTWSLSELEKSTTYKKYGIRNVKKVISILSNLSTSNGFYGMIVVNDRIFSTFERLTTSTLFILDNCIDEMYDNDLKGKNFEAASRKMLKKRGLIVLPRSVEIFEPMVPKDIALKLWGKEKNRTDLDIIAVKGNALLIIECKDAKFKLSFLKQGNKFKNFVIEQYYRVQWIKTNFAKFTNYVQNEFANLGINLSQEFFLFPLVVSNTLVNIKNFEGAPLVSYSELEKLVSIDWKINVHDHSKEIVADIDGRLHHLPWFTNSDK
jgi:hypothetical protein